MAWNINLTIRVILDRAAPNLDHAIINQKLDIIMSKISEFIDKQTAFNTAQSTGLTSVATSMEDLSGDVDTLNEKITELQNSPDRVTPEDQARIDTLETEGTELAAKMTAVSEALAALAAKTPPKPPVVEDPPTPEARGR